MNKLLRGCALFSLSLMIGVSSANAIGTDQGQGTPPSLFNNPGNKAISAPVTIPGSGGSNGSGFGSNIFNNLGNIGTSDSVGTPGIGGGTINIPGFNGGDSTVFVPPTADPNDSGRSLLDPQFSGQPSSVGTAKGLERKLQALGDEGIQYTPAELAAIEDKLCNKDILDRLKRQQAAAQLVQTQASLDRVTQRAAVPSAGALACTPLFQARIANAAIDLVQSNGFAQRFFNVQVLDLGNLGSNLPIGGALVGAIGASISQEVGLLVSDIASELTSGLFGSGGIDFSADDCNAMQEVAQLVNCASSSNPSIANLGSGNPNASIDELCATAVDARRFMSLF